MTTKPKIIDTSAGRVHKNPIAELMREAATIIHASAESLAEFNADPITGYVDEETRGHLSEEHGIAFRLRAAADEIERQEPVAIVDEGDDGMWAEILPDRTVKVGQFLYAHPLAGTGPAIPEETLSPYEILGWCHAYFCCSLDAGEDPRTTEVGDIIEKMNRQLLAAAPQPTEQQLAPPNDPLQGIEYRADGEANFYTLSKTRGNWLARIQFNGELRILEQEKLLEAMLGDRNVRYGDGYHDGYWKAKGEAPDVEALVEALQGLLNIVSDSSGVAGYHLNGNIADWDEFEEVENAEVALSTYSKQGAEE